MPRRNAAEAASTAASTASGSREVTDAVWYAGRGGVYDRGMRSLLLLAALASLAAGPVAAAEAPAAIAPGGVIPLFNGKDLSGWEADVPARDTDKGVRDSFIVRDGLLVSLGKPEGHLLTK